MKEKNKRTTVIASPIMLAGMILCLIMSYSILIFMYTAPVVNLEDFTWFSHVGLVFFTGFCPTAILFTARRWFYTITIDKMGVRIKYLGAIPIRKMMWQEIREVRSVAWSGQWLFFSKSSLEGLNYSQIIKQKDIIQIAYREKVVKIVQNYCAEIIGMPDNA